MHFDELSVGDFRICVGALEDPNGGYFAAVVVSRAHGFGAAPREPLQDTRFTGGPRWDTPYLALQYALAQGREFVSSRSASAAC